MKLLICAACQYGKLSSFSFQQNKAYGATLKLQLIHADVGGPMNTSSLNHNKFYISLIDDWLYKNMLDLFYETLI